MNTSKLAGPMNLLILMTISVGGKVMLIEYLTYYM
jgi:hypothetical protein